MDRPWMGGIGRISVESSIGMKRGGHKREAAGAGEEEAGHVHGRLLAERWRRGKRVAAAAGRETSLSCLRQVEACTQRAADAQGRVSGRISGIRARRGCVAR